MRTPPAGTSGSRTPRPGQSREHRRDTVGGRRPRRGGGRLADGGAPHRRGRQAIRHRVMKIASALAAGLAHAEPAVLSFGVPRASTYSHPHLLRSRCGGGAPFGGLNPGLPPEGVGLFLGCGAAIFFGLIFDPGGGRFLRTDPTLWVTMSVRRVMVKSRISSEAFALR
jgi:hypothetical protein